MKTPNLFHKFCLLVCLLFVGAMAYAQFQVTGQVVDGNGEPIIGASVLEAGTSNGTITDVNGNFTLSVSQKGAHLTFSYVGFKSADYQAIEKMNVKLADEVEALEELVVVGYGVQKKSNVTGSISSVKSEDMQNRTVVDPASALQGKSSGVQVISSSARPGASPTIRVRGYSSNASSDPLYVVDGVRVSSIGGLDPNDIESMEILKDASSAAIYGAEAGNGVVLITTKRGKKGEGKIKYDFMITSQSVGKTPKMLNAQEYVNYMTEGGYFLKENMMQIWDGKTSTDWMKETFENGLMHRHNLSFSGGNDRGSYYLSLSYLNNNGIVKGDKDTYQRFTAAINADYLIKKWLKVGTTNQIEKYDVKSVSENNEYGSLFSATLTLDPCTPFSYTKDQLTEKMQNLLSQGKTLLQDENGNYFSLPLFYEGENCHPFAMRDNGIATNSGFNVTGSIFADLMPVKGLTITSRFGYRLSSGYNSTVSLPYYGSIQASKDFLDLNTQNSSTLYYQWENFATYMNNWNGHGLNAMIGMSYSKNIYNNTYGEIKGDGGDAIKKNDPGFYFLNFKTDGATQITSGEQVIGTKYSYFGRLSYDYKNRYMLQATLRADAADLSKLPRGNRWGFFPSVSAGWTISEEEFFAPAKKVVDLMKFRLGWGQNGSLSALSGYLYSADIASGNGYCFTDGLNYTASAAPGTMGNNDLRWETSEQFNVGVDMYMLNGRLNATVEYYNKRTKDLLIYNTKPSLSIGGATSPMNAGNVSNQGVEIDLGWQDKVGDFSYGIRGNLATLKNEVTYLDPSIPRAEGQKFHNYTMTWFEQGYPVYHFYGYQVECINPETGDPVFKDLDGDGSITDNDRTDIGNAIPKVTYGLTLNLAWKGIDFTVFGAGAAGNKIFNCVNRPDRPNANQQYDIWYADRWTHENSNATMPRAGYEGNDKYVCSDAMVFDGSYFKIKQIQLGYTLPQKWTKKALINNFRLYASLDDFFTITKYKGFDPEACANSTSGMGIDKGTYPTSRKIVFGLNVEF
ncbi:MAG: TonB-dependent receptor [Paludibacteraceae bacterium]|nr:TonB-dependent receptor [Paludibacteraceae bacterium]